MKVLGQEWNQFVAQSSRQLRFVPGKEVGMAGQKHEGIVWCILGKNILQFAESLRGEFDPLLANHVEVRPHIDKCKSPTNRKVEYRD